MSELNLIFDFEKDDDVYNRDAYHYLINMMKMRRELNRLKKEELAHKKMVELFEKHQNEAHTERTLRLDVYKVNTITGNQSYEGKFNGKISNANKEWVRL